MFKIFSPPQVIDYIYSHEYRLNKLSSEYKSYVLNHIGSVLDVRGYSNNIKNILTNVYPGFTSEDFQRVDEYFNNVYDSQFNGRDKVISPRGYIGNDSIIIVGIAPGVSDLSYGESNLLHGPSSKLLHSMLTYDYRWYFTNVYKRPFPGNRYDEQTVFKDMFEFISELDFFGDSAKYVFLGNYSIFDGIIEEYRLKNYIRVFHPSYLLRTSHHVVEATAKRISEFSKI